MLVRMRRAAIMALSSSTLRAMPMISEGRACRQLLAADSRRSRIKTIIVLTMDSKASTPPVEMMANG